MQNIHRFECKNLFGLLHSIASNIIKSFIKKHSKIVYTDDFTNLHYEEDDLTGLIYIKYAISKLKPKDKTIMTLRFLEQYNFKEINIATGIPETTIKRRVKKFLIKIEKELKDDKV